MLQFKDVKDGDRVWCILNGWGTVDFIFDGRLDVKFALAYDSYDRRTGKQIRNDQQKSAAQMLFWDKVDVVPPPRKMKVDTLVWVDVGNHMARRHFSHYQVHGDVQSILVFNEGRSSQTAYHENDLARYFVWTFTDPALTKDK